MDRIATLNVRPEVIAGLKPHPGNYNRHTEAQLNELTKSIRRHGAYKNAVVSADGYILAGHGLLQAARIDGWEQWPCERRDYPHDHPDALNLLLTDNEVGNPTNPLGPDPDQSLLAALAQQVNEATGLEGTGMDDTLLAALMGSDLQEFDAGSELAEGGIGMVEGKYLLAVVIDEECERAVRMIGDKATLAQIIAEALRRHAPQA